MKVQRAFFTPLGKKHKKLHHSGGHKSVAISIMFAIAVTAFAFAFSLAPFTSFLSLE